MSFVKRDKKVLSEDEIEVILINEHGNPYLFNLNFETIKRKLKAFFEEMNVGKRE